jgi:hypothetical protein
LALNLLNIKLKVGFLPLDRNLKVIFSGFAIPNPLDSRMAKATEINEMACGLN